MLLQATDHPVLGERLVFERLENGLSVFVMPKPGFAQKYAIFATRYGSVDSRFIPPGGQPVRVPDGIAHFLEHKLFEKQQGDVFDRFAQLGASANAYTTFTMTAYLFSCVENFDQSFELLLRFVQEPYFSEAGIAKEQGIIEQELRMYEDDPYRTVYRNLMEALYHVNPVRIDIGGTVESIRQIDRERLYLCYRTFYRPSNMAVAVVGDVDPATVVEEVRRLTPDQAPPGGGPASRDGGKAADAEEIVRLFDPEPPSVRSPRVDQAMSVSLPRYALGIKDPKTGLSGRALLKREILINLALEVAIGRSSALFEALYAEGLIDDRFGGRYAAETRFGHSVVGGESRDPDQLHRRLVEGLVAIAREGIREPEFERVRRKEIGEFVSAMDSPELVANSLISLHFRGSSLFEYLELLDEITLEELNRHFAAHIDPGQMAVSVITPGAGTPPAEVRDGD